MELSLHARRESKTGLSNIPQTDTTAKRQDVQEAGVVQTVLDFSKSNYVT
jgi:hypothetical protein